MIKSINGLASIGAEVVLVPCNSAHYFYSDVASQIDIPWINMIECVAERIQKTGYKFPLILGGFVTTNKRLYSKFIPSSVYLGDIENRVIEGIIEEIKLTSKLSNESRNKLTTLTNAKKNIDCVVLACTELPIVFHEDELYGIDVVDSNLEYAKKVIEYARA